MKKYRIGVHVLLMSVFLFTGCVYHTASSPGNVTVPQGEKQDLEKIVTLTVVGKGIEPEAATTRGQARLMAERAAIADGYRQFVEKIRGVLVEASMESGFGMVQKDAIKTSTRSWLRGVEVIEIKQGDYGITEAHMQLRINFTKKGLIWWPTGLGKDLST